MGANRVALELAWCELIAKESTYYTSAAKYLLLESGIDRPSENQIKKKINYLFHIYTVRT